MRWLSESIGIAPEDIGRMILKCPHILNPIYHEEFPILYDYLVKLGLKRIQIAMLMKHNPW